MNETTELYERAKRRIPGGTQLLSKRPEMFLPGEWPAYYRRARGVEIEDLDGRTWIDVTIGAVGSCPLGYADPDVNAAVVEAVRCGPMTTLNCPEEVELAELLCELHPWAEMVRYARTGGEVMAMAARLARAATGRDVVAISGYHGWHDWYLAANLSDDRALDGHLLAGLDPAGVPRGLEGTAVTFPHGDRAAFDAVTTAHGDRLAAVIMEPMRKAPPPAGFLEHVRTTANRLGAVLVFDEITSGFRMNVGGLHMRLGATPDVAVFAKAIGNGHPMAAVVGRREVMEAAQDTFISSTYWTERIGPTAALATIRKMRDHDVPARLVATGRRMREGWQRLAGLHGLEIEVGGIPPLSTFTYRHGDASRAMTTLYTQEMLDRGFLASGAFYAMYAHESRHVDAALTAADEAFARIRSDLDRGSVEESLRGPVAHEGFKRLT
ncbi:MAG: aminotransferase class III-fold pyridoxal phosphate-dependent enzyme [Acidobacteriota bacterium]|nr:aminotransferase class III-fold pyridoxal phosphate-dependent enzyme [Acidobacteriota bacterium]